MKLDGKSYVVILTRGHVHDALVLEQVLEAGRAGHVAGYVGMIGSRRKREEIYAALRCKGASDAELSRVHCPVGLPIGAGDSWGDRGKHCGGMYCAPQPE